MCAWRVLAMLRRDACVGACQKMSPHHITRFCCAAALGARVYRCGNIGTFLCNRNIFRYQPILLHLLPQGQFFNDYFFCFFFAKIADDRQQTTCRGQNATGRTMCACGILSLRRRVAFFIACHVLSSCSLVLNTFSLHNILESKPHPTPHVPLLASWRPLSCSSKCDALLEIIRMIRCKSFVCCQVVLCVFLIVRSVVGTSILSTQRC